MPGGANIFLVIYWQVEKTSTSTRLKKQKVMAKEKNQYVQVKSLPGKFNTGASDANFTNLYYRDEPHPNEWYVGRKIRRYYYKDGDEYKAINGEYTHSKGLNDYNNAVKNIPYPGPYPRSTQDLVIRANEQGIPTIYFSDELDSSPYTGNYIDNRDFSPYLTYSDDHYQTNTGAPIGVQSEDAMHKVIKDQHASETRSAAAAIIGALGTAGSAAVSAGSNSNMSKKNRQWTEQQTEKQWSHDEEVAERNYQRAIQAYQTIDSPAALRAAYQAAGLAPMVGDATPGFFDAPQQETTETKPYQDVYGQQQQAEMFARAFTNASNVALTLASTKKTEAEAEGQQIENDFSEERIRSIIDLNTALSGLYRQKILTEKEETDLKYWMKNRQYLEYKIDSASYFTRLDMIREGLRNLRESTGLLESLRKLNDKHREEIDSIIFKNLADGVTTIFSMNVMAAKSLLYDEQASYYHQQSRYTADTAEVLEKTMEKLIAATNTENQVTLDTFEAVKTAITSDAAAQQFWSSPENLKTMLNLQVKLANIRNREVWMNGINKLFQNLIDAYEVANPMSNVGPGKMGKAIPRKFTTSTTN